MNDHTGRWLYAVTDALPCGPVAAPPGIDDALVEAVCHDGIAAIVSPVDLDRFDETALARRLEDLDWLAAAARRHHAVIDAVHHLGTTVPMRLATVYSSPRLVTRLLADRHTLLRRALDAIHGRTEWGVKAYATTPTAAETAAPASGADYLRRRRAALAEAETGNREAWDAAQHVFGELGRLATAQRRHRPQDAKLSGRTETMLLNGSFLIADERQDDFTAAMSKLALDNPRLELRLSGPWPPYSFSGLAVTV